MQIISRAEAIAAIRRDYDSNYFVSGRGQLFPHVANPASSENAFTKGQLRAGDMDAYEPDCLFADPFAGFNGVERFQKNVSNLGGLMCAANALLHTACSISDCMRAACKKTACIAFGKHGRGPEVFRWHPCREDIKLDVTGWEEEEEALRTKWRFSAILSLPWRPRLAAAGGTTHVFSKVGATFHDEC